MTGRSEQAALGGGTGTASRSRFAWAGFVLGLLGLVSSILLWASYIRLVSRVAACGWLEAKPLTWSGTVSPLLALVGVLVSGGTLLVLREEGQQRRRGLARIGLVTGLLGLSVVYPWFMCGRDLGRRSVCAANMSVLAKTMRIYAGQHYFGQYPPDLQSVVRVWPGFERCMTCSPSPTDDVEKWYGYIPGSWESKDPKDVILYEKRGNHLSDGANVMFANLYVEWIQPYSRVVELVEQTEARLVAKAAQSAPAPIASVATQPDS